MGVIVLTAGHSYSDPGAVSGGFTESALMVDLRDRTAEILRSEWGCVVIEDGEDGENLPLRHAISLIKQGGLALELHVNAHDNPQARGVETISLPHQRRFSRRLSAAVAEVLGTRVRGDRGWIDQSQSHRGRLGYVQAGGVILETFFISNPAERATYLERLPEVAFAIAATVADEVEQ